MSIHPTAIISPDARLAESVEVGPYSIIGPRVRIDSNTVIGPHVVIEGDTNIGENCQIRQFASIGGAPQDLKFQGEETRVVIGRENTIRECATIHRATSAGEGVTRIGDHNLLMAYCHVAHNCILGSHIVLANAANLAGHVEVEDHVTVGGLTGVHQFTRIGAHAFVGGASAVNRDIPPFVLASGNLVKLYGLNLVGLRRRNFAPETIEALKEAYRLVFRSGLRLQQAIQQARQDVPNLPEVLAFLAFLERSERGVCR